MVLRLNKVKILKGYGQGLKRQNPSKLKIYKDFLWVFKGQNLKYD
jgi:hypothetical protein